MKTGSVIDCSQINDTRFGCQTAVDWDTTMSICSCSCFCYSGADKVTNVAGANATGTELVPGGDPPIEDPFTGSL
jgi:hypothetical protein